MPPSTARRQLRSKVTQIRASDAPNHLHRRKEGQVSEKMRLMYLAYLTSQEAQRNIKTSKICGGEKNYSSQEKEDTLLLLLLLMEVDLDPNGTISGSLVESAFGSPRGLRVLHVRSRRVPPEGTIECSSPPPSTRNDRNNIRRSKRKRCSSRDDEPSYIDRIYNFFVRFVLGSKDESSWTIENAEKNGDQNKTYHDFLSPKQPSSSRGYCSFIVQKASSIPEFFSGLPFSGELPLRSSPASSLRLRQTNPVWVFVARNQSQGCGGRGKVRRGGSRDDRTIGGQRS